jgi:hypothetical protein
VLPIAVGVGLAVLRSQPAVLGEQLGQQCTDLVGTVSEAVDVGGE